MFWNLDFCSKLPLGITVDVLSKRQFHVCNMTITCVCWQAVCLTKSIYNLQKHWQILFTRQHIYNTLYMCWPLGDWSCEGLVWWIHSTPAESEALKSKQASWSAAFHKRHNNNNNNNNNNITSKQHIWKKQDSRFDYNWAIHYFTTIQVLGWVGPANHFYFLRKYRKSVFLAKFFAVYPQ